MLGAHKKAADIGCFKATPQLIPTLNLKYFLTAPVGLDHVDRFPKLISAAFKLFLS
ncbi:hypothetical protein PghCCS26_61950 [Paenibacillus glycanilyticus]|uniref:Uncharacterized protein n=1 Tax=Paenibacillus glycanilyticus TaxID=126569 RepID=A0ABQ6NY73_9BACL|nr:hypothetical protein PghCCS26_61950 [Paenibacillus glycanilyticus]